MSVKFISDFRYLRCPEKSSMGLQRSYGRHGTILDKDGDHTENKYTKNSNVGISERSTSRKCRYERERKGTSE